MALTLGCRDREQSPAPEAQPNKPPSTVDAAPPELAEHTAMPAPAELPAAGSCFAGSIEDWAKRMRATTDGRQARALLGEAGLLFDEAYVADLLEVKVEVELESVELDGEAPAEELVEVVLDGRPETRVVAAVFIERGGKHCPIGYGALSAGLEPLPDESYQSGPPFRRPVDFEALELIAADRKAIGRRVAIGSESSDPSAAYFGLSYHVFEDGKLVEVFEHVMHEWMTSTYADDPIVDASFELGEALPKTIRATTTTDCKPVRDSCKRTPEACEQVDTSCKQGSVTRTWRYRNGRYRRDPE